MKMLKQVAIVAASSAVQFGHVATGIEDKDKG